MPPSPHVFHALDCACLGECRSCRWALELSTAEVHAACTNKAPAAHLHLACRGEYRSYRQVLDRAIAEAYAAGYLGRDACGSGHDFHVYTHPGAGAYVCGERRRRLRQLTREAQQRLQQRG